jgi:hypothetical protein
MRVQEGDIIKFGRVRFRVKQIVIDQVDIKEEEAQGASPKKGSINYDNEAFQSGYMVNDTMLVSEAN